MHTRLSRWFHAAVHRRGPDPITPTPAGPTALLSRAWWVDALAGLSVAGVLLPEAVAYAGIAGVEPMHALLAALIGLCIYPWLGTSRFAVLAPTSSAAAVFASAVAIGGLAMGYALVGLTGMLFMAAGALRAGFLGAFISRPVLRGFTWGLATTIILKQLPHVAGVDVPAPEIGALLQGLWSQAPQWHFPSIILGVAALALWLLVRRVLRRWVFVPSSFIVLASGIAASATWALGEQGIALVGHIRWQQPLWHLPQLSTEHWLRAAEIAPALLLILFAESWGSVRSLALQRGDRVDASRELMALGAANLAIGLAQGLPVGAGFSAAAANQAAGARSRFAGVAAALALALMLWWARPWIALLPMPVLAAVVIGILSHNLWPRAAISALHLGSDAWLALAAAAGVLFFGVLFGMTLAVTLSLALALRRFAQPVVTELGQLGDTRDYVDRARHPEVKGVDNVLIMRPEEPLFFANAEQIFQRVQERAEPAGVQVVVLSLEVCDDLDTTAAEALQECAQRLRETDTTLLLARVKDRPREAIHRLWAQSHQGQIAEFWSVADAVDAAIALRRDAPKD